MTSPSVPQRRQSADRAGFFRIVNGSTPRNGAIFVRAEQTRPARGPSLAARKPIAQRRQTARQTPGACARMQMPSGKGRRSPAGRSTGATLLSSYALFPGVAARHRASIGDSKAHNARRAFRQAGQQAPGCLSPTGLTLIWSTFTARASGGPPPRQPRRGPNNGGPAQAGPKESGFSGKAAGSPGEIGNSLVEFKEL